MSDCIRQGVHYKRHRFTKRVRDGRYQGGRIERTNTCVACGAKRVEKKQKEETRA